jgi:hypothetical protein
MGKRILVHSPRKARPWLDLKTPLRTARPLAKHWRKAKLELQQQKVRQTELVRPLRMGKLEQAGELMLRTESPLAMAKRLRKVRLELDRKLQP